MNEIHASLAGCLLLYLQRLLLPAKVSLEFAIEEAEYTVLSNGFRATLYVHRDTLTGKDTEELATAAADKLAMRLRVAEQSSTVTIAGDMIG